MNKLLETISELDPEYAWREKWRMRTFTATVFIALAAVGLAVYAVAVNVDQSTDITKIERSACAQVAAHPQTVNAQARRECEHIRQSVSEGEELRGPCILYQRASGRRGGNCPRFYVPRDGRARLVPTSPSQSNRPPRGSRGPSDTPSGNPVRHPPSTPQGTAPHHPGGSPGGHSEPPSGTGVSNPPASPAPSPSPAPESHQGPGAPSTPTAPPAASKRPIRQTAGALGETVDGALEGVGRTGCKLLGCQNP